jgi:hypothetical protein
MNNFKKLNLTILCMLLAGSQVHSMTPQATSQEEQERMDLILRNIENSINIVPGLKQEFIIKNTILNELKKNKYYQALSEEDKKQILKSLVEKYQNSQSPQIAPKNKDILVLAKKTASGPTFKETYEIKGRQKKIMQAANEKAIGDREAQEDLQIEAFNSSDDIELDQEMQFQNILKKYEELLQSTELTDAGADFKKRAALTPEEKKTLIEREAATKNYLKANEELISAQDHFNHLSEEKKENQTNRPALREKIQAHDEAAKNFQELLNHVGTLVDPNFKPYKPTSSTRFTYQDYQDIEKHIIDNMLNYQARLNQLHEDYGPSTKLTPEQKIAFLKMIIPSIEALPKSGNFSQEELARNLTGTINR